MDIPLKSHQRTHLRAGPSGCRPMASRVPLSVTNLNCCVNFVSSTSSTYEQKNRRKLEKTIAVPSSATPWQLHQESLGFHMEALVASVKKLKEDLPIRTSSSTVKILSQTTPLTMDQRRKATLTKFCPRYSIGTV